jgi:hypothetical protein
VVLDAIARAGAGASDRAAVARAGLTPRTRASVLGRYRISALGDISPTRFGGFRRTASALQSVGIRTPPRSGVSSP